MNNHVRFCMVAIMMTISAIALSAQTPKETRKEKREARKEMRLAEREARKSARTVYSAEEEVNIGYGSTKRSNLTTSVSKVSINEDIISSYANIGEYLMGRVPGLQVSKNGNEYKYTVRGINSINSGTDPLFVVNGVEVMSIDDINPRDVRSVEVLKDASASIYGTKGACGVILITVGVNH